MIIHIIIVFLNLLLFQKKKHFKDFFAIFKFLQNIHILYKYSHLTD